MAMACILSPYQVGRYLHNPSRLEPLPFTVINLDKHDFLPKIERGSFRHHSSTDTDQLPRLPGVLQTVLVIRLRNAT